MQRVTAEMIEELARRDDRVGRIQLGLDVVAELDRSVALRTVMDACRDDAAEALELLATADPTDTARIVRLQAMVYRARFVSRTLSAVIDRGREAEVELVEELD